MNNSFIKLNLPIDIYADGPELEEIKNFDNNIIKGYTFNPTLFRKLEIIDYLSFCKKLVNVCGKQPISLEVIADEKEEIIRQGKILSELGTSVFVKVPITYTSGLYTLEAIESLMQSGVKLNITAIFTMEQVKEILPILKNTNSIISLFAGRIFDIGKDAVNVVGEISKFVHNDSNCKVLWASPRMVYDVHNAINAKCDIITMQSDLIKKLSLLNKTSEEYSLDTVKMFYNDAKKSGYSF
ncbi:MAG: transaldolase [Pelagibacteraceae bacterium]|nr:transaldolase [Pelagibacteraceae bacterium]PPR51282.1 MAG: Transaldolase [Alphaproteobacteria bacterium MarineAlpha5_Bin10]|tara:strand:+ start:24104 stop:24823 length:720 start_codon:yes stop_codon:yes gene_type:complete